MSRPNAVIAMATLFFVAGSACQALLGGVDVIPAPQGPERASGSVSGEAPAAQPIDVGQVSAPRDDPQPFPLGGIELGESLSPREDGAAASLDAGRVDPVIDAGRPPLVARPIVVQGPVSDLTLVGAEGGQPHRGTCAGGIIVGVVPTANPSAEVFGQRLTSIEPICGQAVQLPALNLGERSRVTVVRDDSILTWDATAPFQGPPPNEVPDPRLIWAVQPAALCTETAPVLVGLSGEYDPVAPDVGATAAIRSLVIECAPLVVALNGVDVAAAASGHQFIAQADGFATVGNAAYDASCQGGSVVTELQVHAGYWLDGFVLGCSSLQSPRLAGEPCLTEGECQSGVCSPAGACAP